LFLLPLPNPWAKICRIACPGSRLWRICLALWIFLSLWPAASALQAQSPIVDPQNVDAEIVYLDAQGYIRVLDTLHPNTPAVAWLSPVGGWQDFALGDFNGDGDVEIGAVKNVAGGGQLTIYDPVIAAGSIVPNQLINGIPWRILYETTMTSIPFLVAAGELDPATPGDEIVYLARRSVDDGDEIDLALLHATNRDGFAWTQFAEQRGFNGTRSQITVGELVGGAAEEVVLVDDEGVLEVYEVKGSTITRIFNRESNSRPWQAATIARFFSVGPPGLVASRASSPGAASFWVFVYEPNEEGNFRDAYSEFFLPAPERLFVGDINGNGDEEIFFLRTVPSNITNLPRLVMRNRGTDQLPVFEQPLDTDNGYQGGTAADVDGDSCCVEVIIMRDNRIRIYGQPEFNATFTEITPPVATNQRTIHAANLDRNGAVKTPTFTVSPGQLTGGVAAGEQSTIGNFLISNTGEGSSIPFTLRTEGTPAWLRLDKTSGTTPATFAASFDARMLDAGVYTTNIIVESSNDQVSNTPLLIGVTLTVRPGLMPRSLGIMVAATSCASDAPNVVVALPIDGPAGMTFVAKILATGAESQGNTVDASASTAMAPSVVWPSAAAWVSAQSTNSAPTTMLLTFTPQALINELVNATLELTAADAVGEQVRRVPLTLLCTQGQSYLPLIAAQ